MDRVADRIIGGAAAAASVFIACSFIAMDVTWLFDALTVKNGPPVVVARVAMVGAFVIGALDPEMGESIRDWIARPKSQ